MKGIIRCKICNKQFGNNKSKIFEDHIYQEHKLSPAEYAIQFYTETTSDYNIAKINSENFELARHELIHYDIFHIKQAYNKSIKSRKWLCWKCGKYCGSKSSFESHLKRKHKLTNEEYCLECSFNNFTPNFKYEKCGFCNNDAKCIFEYDNVNRTYNRYYDKTYRCYSNKCTDDICLKYFNKSYENSKSQHEHIGANSKYLSQLYKLPIDVVKRNLKQNENYTVSKRSKTNLTGFILRYGKTEGTKRYKDRCRKISYSLTYDWFLEKYQDPSIALEKYQKRHTKKYKNTSISNGQLDFYNKFKDYISHIEYPIFTHRVDFYNEEFNFVIEYYGTYWHMKPTLYNEDFYNKSLNCTAKEKWKLDNNRLKLIQENSNNCNILIVWEDSIINSDQFNTIFKLFKDNKNKKIIIEL